NGHGSGMGLVDFELDQTTTSKLLQQAGLAYRTQINELLLSALLLGFNRWSGNDTIRIDLEGHGREDLSPAIDLSQTVGWFTTIYPLTLTTETLDMPTLICAVKEGYRATPNRGIGYGILKYLSQDEVLCSAPSSDIVFNYLGQFDQTLSQDSYLKPATEYKGQSISAKRQLRHALSFNGGVSGGCLRFSVMFDRSRFNDESVALLAGHVRDALKDVTNHCLEPDAGVLTASDFPLASISQVQLDAWLPDYPLEDIYPATAMQQGLLFHSSLDRSAYVTQMTFKLAGEMDSANFREGWLQVIERHPILRTAFVTDDSGTIQQLVLKTVELPWHQHNLSELTGDQQAQVIEQYRQEDKAQG
ncbi:MAG: condensation domain-containing protein, partial [Psychrosphaera sp.]|nr:condensation domain-containing protein [Psychrosphaera sp.]